MPARVYVDQLAAQSVKVLGLNQPSDYAMPSVPPWNLRFGRPKERLRSSVRSPFGGRTASNLSQKSTWSRRGAIAQTPPPTAGIERYAKNRRIGPRRP